MGFTKSDMAKGGKNSKRGKALVDKSMRKKFKEAVESVDLIADLKAVKPEERLRLVAMLGKYIVPALASIDLTVTDLSVKEYLQLDEAERKNYIDSIMN